MLRSGSVTSLSQGAPRPAARMVCACETMRSHASIAAARRTYDCAGVSTGPSSNVTTGSAFVIRAADGDGCCSGAAASKLSAGSAVAAMFKLAAAAAAPSIAGKRLAGASDDADAESDAELAHVAVERSITPRWIRIEGNTLSAKTGRWDVCGMGKGEGPEGSLSRFVPKRMAIAFIKKSAFLKQ